jgi:hypothetical protein
MLYTILMHSDGSGQRIFQAEGNDFNDALIRWAGECEIDGLTEPGRQELIEAMGRLDEDLIRFVSGYNYSETEYLTNVWRFERDLDVEGESDHGVETTFLVIKTAKG